MELLGAKMRTQSLGICPIKKLPSYCHCHSSYPSLNPLGAGVWLGAFTPPKRISSNSYFKGKKLKKLAGVQVR